MTNKEMLKSWGLFERDGWLCSPDVKDESIFRISEVENFDVKFILKTLMACSFNSGAAWQKKKASDKLVKDLETAITKEDVVKEIETVIRKLKV